MPLRNVRKLCRPLARLLTWQMAAIWSRSDGNTVDVANFRDLNLGFRETPRNLIRYHAFSSISTTSWPFTGRGLLWTMGGSTASPATLSKISGLTLRSRSRVGNPKDAMRIANRGGGAFPGRTERTCNAQIFLPKNRPIPLQAGRQQHAGGHAVSNAGHFVQHVADAVTNADANATLPECREP